MTDELTQEEMWERLEENLSEGALESVAEWYRPPSEDADRLFKSDITFLLGVARSEYRIREEEAAGVLREVADHLTENGYTAWGELYDG